MTDRPNILLFMSDQHNRQVMGCAGDPIVRTPHLDRLAGQGVRFTNAYCANPVCGPSRMTFLTSRYSCDIKVWNNGAYLASDVATFVHHLALAGYETILCGRTHFLGPDQRHGYERRIVGEVQWAGPLDFEQQPMTSVRLRYSGPGRTPHSTYDEHVTAAACRFLESDEAVHRGRPWFMTVGTMLPHDPYICPPRLFEHYLPQVDVPPLPNGYHESLHPAMQLWRKRWRVDEVSDEQLRIAKAGYYGSVAYEDELIGRVLEALDRRGLSDNTMVVYTSDHGEQAGHQRMWWKTTFYEGSVGVPLIVRWPGQGQTGGVVNEVCSLVDVGPTLVDAVGGEPMPHVSGRSLRRFLQGQPVPDWPNTIFAEKVHRPHEREPARMIRSGPWKLNHYHGYDRPQLFNLDNDPGEWHDLGADPQFADVRDDLMHQVLDGWSAEDVLRYFEVWDADRSLRDRFDATAHVRPNEAPDPWVPPDDCTEFDL